MNPHINSVCCDHHGYRFFKNLKTTALHTPIFPAPIRRPTPNRQEQSTFSQVCTAISCADLLEADFANIKSQVQVPFKNLREIFSSSQQSVIIGKFVIMGFAFGFLPEK